MAEDRERPGELDPPEVGVPEDVPEGCNRVPQTCLQTHHGAEHLTGTCRVEVGQGRFRSTHVLWAETRESHRAQQGGEMADEDLSDEV